MRQQEILAAGPESLRLRLREIPQRLGEGVEAKSYLFAGHNPMGRTAQDPVMVVKAMKDPKWLRGDFTREEYYRRALDYRRQAAAAVPEKFRPRSLGTSSNKNIGIEAQEYVPYKGTLRQARTAYTDSAVKASGIEDLHPGNLGGDRKGNVKIFDPMLPESRAPLPEAVTVAPGAYGPSYLSRAEDIALRKRLSSELQSLYAKANM